MESLNLDRITKADFDTAYRKGFWRSVIHWFTQDNNSLLPFDEVRRKLPIKGQHYIGMREIPLDQVVGSVGRYHDFDRAFLPRQTRTKNRWMSVDRAHLQDLNLPPIEVYKIGSTYFVKDGNHRVSVAREKKQVFIDAEVIELDVSVPIDPNIDINDLIKKKEQAEFLDRTHIKDLRPDAEITLTVPGGYSNLIEHIKVHRWFMGEHLQSEVPWENAVVDWYDKVYCPLVTIIQENKILKKFPERTDTDLYLWIIDHLWHLRKEYNHEISMEAAAVNFTEKFSPRLLRRILNIIRQVDPLSDKKSREIRGTMNTNSNNL